MTGAIESATRHHARSVDLARLQCQLIEPLTGRELEVIERVCNGESNCEIAVRLKIGLPTVKFHLKQIFGKLGACRRTQAVAIVVHLGLVQPSWLAATTARLENAAV